MSDEVEELGRGRFLRLLRRRGWELVERPGVTGIVVLVAVTDAGELLLVEQYREPVRARVIELPAGLAGDRPGTAGEALVEAARRELVEETGYEASELQAVTEGPPSAGLTSEVVTFVRARDLTRVGPGGGAGDESIEVHVVPLAEVPSFLRRRRHEAGCLVDPKVYAGLYLLAAE